jgi:hypothetical protein
VPSIELGKVQISRLSGGSSWMHLLLDMSVDVGLGVGLSFMLLFCKDAINHPGLAESFAL